jgi:hypothetical protein
MPAATNPSEFQFDKRRVVANVTLSGGQTARGRLFTAAESTRYHGPERVGDLLNASTGFFPFELDAGNGSRTVLYNRAHVVMVELTENEAERDAGYSVAPRRFVSVLLSTGHRVAGWVRVYQPTGRDRLSDWTRQPETFRYLETGDLTLLINAAHIVDISEVPEP